jgi:hypothetical protein
MEKTVSITIEVPMSEMLDMVERGKIETEWCPDRHCWLYEPHFEMPVRIDDYKITDSAEAEEDVAQALIEECREGAAA